MGLSILLRGTIQEKLNWAFNLYDINKDGYITKEVRRDTTGVVSEWRLLTGRCVIYPDPCLCVSGNAGHHEGHLWHDGKMHVPRPQRGDASSARRGFLSGKCVVGGSHSSVFVSQTTEALAEPLCCCSSRFLSRCVQQKMDKNKDGVVTIDEFIDCCQNVSWMRRDICSRYRRHLRASSPLLTVVSLSTGWKHHAIDAPLWKCSLTLGGGGGFWKRTSSSTWTRTVYSVLCRLWIVDKISFITVGHK